MLDLVDAPQCNIGEFAGLERAEFLFAAEHARPTSGRKWQSIATKKAVGSVAQALHQ